MPVTQVHHDGLGLVVSACGPARCAVASIARATSAIATRRSIARPASTDAPAGGSRGGADVAGKPVSRASRRTYAASSAEPARRPWSMCERRPAGSRRRRRNRTIVSNRQTESGPPETADQHGLLRDEHPVVPGRGADPLQHPGDRRRSGDARRYRRRGRSSAAGRRSPRLGKVLARLPHQVERVHARARRSRARIARRSRTARSSDRSRSRAGTCAPRRWTRRLAGGRA